MASRDITPFHLDVPQHDLDDLRERLARTRWADEVPGLGWSYGPPLAYLRELAEYWRDGYDWRAQEARLNAFPQHTTEIDGATIHFLHVRSPRPDALPLLITHGWPSSVAEYLDVVEPLTEAGFHLVIPSLPGYGLSGPTASAGWGAERVARAWAELMSRLGYARYGLQGGDWGTWISRTLAINEPERVVGLHTNGMITFPSGDPDEFAKLTDADHARMARWQRYTDELYGYKLIQSTKPQSLAYSLADSPVGLLGWIVGVLKEWTDCADTPEDAIDRDRILTTVMLYWLTNTAGSAARSFVETPDNSAKAEEEGVIEQLTDGTVPHGVAVFPKDVLAPVRPFAERINNIVRWTEYDRGGTFPAMEQPDLYVRDVREFFASL
ncbi:Pimeloyl-ACP methyl ester carboxylesterase [Saccharopolyspora antimicrobica]|uniref:Pimeloyl-ACP methyl ester carboxylesterase n=1 Tax=Saccharopolyspora antimicrobica TaxID=455193 RepID=A0A1I4XRW8_9PSEU|nr:epoxide hydrolase family protein [Saccharopolyspora antimicrobica]RKT84621.1 pimeloyl-ACP methyl ester carboxylesterase [Saccharopolyspora antimicrobica]SFN28562.1 Pimeloyl-ACP methyl ester carboxylesterase [Saccharopolyspora antimicrobica]